MYSIYIAKIMWNICVDNSIDPNNTTSLYTVEFMKFTHS